MARLRWTAFFYLPEKKSPSEKEGVHAWRRNLVSGWAQPPMGEEFLGGTLGLLFPLSSPFQSFEHILYPSAVCGRKTLQEQ